METKMAVGYIVGLLVVFFALSLTINTTTQSLNYSVVVPQSLRVVLLLPKDHKRLFSYGRMVPSALEAMTKIQRDKLLPSFYLDLKWRDSNCSEINSMNEAIQMYINWRPHVFFGPVCDFAAAPLARQVTFWSIPLITVGATARAFQENRQTEFPLLTRAGPANVPSLVGSFLDLFRIYGWRKCFLVLEETGMDYIQPKYSYLIAVALVYQEWVDVSMEYITLETYKKNLGSMLTEKLGSRFGE